MHSHCHSYMVHWQNMSSKPAMIYFRMDAFQRGKKEKNLRNNTGTSLQFVLWWLLVKVENAADFRGLDTKFCIMVSSDHLPFVDLRVGR